jgi:AmmeMemoRadiSam system protein A
MTEDEKSPAAGHEDELPGLTDDHRGLLKRIAHEAVQRQVEDLPQQRFLYEDPVLKRGWGVFVTLKVRGELRGCIGTLMTDRSLPETVAEMAIKSASLDPRFPPIGPAELKDLDIDISILGPLTEVKDKSEIIIGRHGLVIEHGGRHGLLLPQVATEHNLGVEAFLSQTCLKAGLPPDAWKRGARISKFSAEVF